MNPALVPLVVVAGALGPLVEEVVFIGGAVAPLLQARSPFPRVRPTLDVDAVIASTQYADLARLEHRLGARGFRNDRSGPHLHRWLTPDGLPFDLVPVGSHLGGTGSPVEAAVIATAERLEIVPGLVIRHASAPGFLALKWAAFQDRGKDDPLASHDLEDILAVIASRETIVDEVTGAPGALRREAVEGARWLLKHPYGTDLLAAHLNHAQAVAATVALVTARLRAIGSA